MYMYNMEPFEVSQWEGAASSSAICYGIVTPLTTGKQRKHTEKNTAKPRLKNNKHETTKKSDKSSIKTKKLKQNKSNKRERYTPHVSESKPMGLKMTEKKIKRKRNRPEKVKFAENTTTVKERNKNARPNDEPVEITQRKNTNTGKDKTQHHQTKDRSEKKRRKKQRNKITRETGKVGSDNDEYSPEQQSVQTCEKKNKNKFKDICTEKCTKQVGSDVRTPKSSDHRKRKINDHDVAQAKKGKLEGLDTHSQTISNTKNKSKRRNRSKKEQNKILPSVVSVRISENESSKFENLARTTNANAKSESKKFATHKRDDEMIPGSKCKTESSRTNWRGFKFDIGKLKQALSSSDKREGKEAEPDVIDKREEKSLSLAQRMKEKLNAARFRYLNEQLYSQTGRQAYKLFKHDPEAFHAYHEGFQSQVNKWPSNPLQRVIHYIQTKYVQNKTTKGGNILVEILVGSRSESLVVADFGCGDAKLAQSVNNKVHSFDIVAVNHYVTACDMANVALRDWSVDICVFCLSLMGTNLVDYLCEANRVLKKGGMMLVAEVMSRFDDVNRFVKNVKQLGFSLLNQDTSGKMFVWFEFKKTSSVAHKAVLPSIELAPCTYKKR